MATTCKIIYNGETRVGVEAPNGQPSQLFKEIFNHPMVNDFDEALDIYKNTRSDKLTKSVFITPATTRAFDIKTEKLKKLTNEYATLTKNLLDGELENEEKFLSLQQEILEETQKEIEKKLNGLDGVEVSFGAPYIGSWEGNYEPSLNMSLTVTDNHRAVEQVLYDMAEETSQDAFVLEESSNLDGTPLTEFTPDGFTHYPQTRIEFDNELTISEKSKLAQDLKKLGFEEFSIDGDYFIISHIDFSENEQQKIENYEKSRNALQRIFSEEGGQIGTNGVKKHEVHIRKSKYVGATNEGDTSSETRTYNRSALFEETQKLDQKESNYSFWQRYNGKTTASYKTALDSGAEEIELGFMDNSGNFTPIKTIRPNFDETTPKGFVNSYIKQGLMADRRKDVNGVSYYQPSGYSQAANGVNSLLIGEQALINLGWGNFQKTRNGYTFNQPVKEELSEIQSILQQELRTILQANTTLREEGNTNKLDENGLKLRLLELLSSLGVNALSMSDYISKYKTKGGVEPSAKALADIANKVVAFEDGNITTEELTEEVAHFIVEGWNQEEIANLLRNIHRTTEWQQFSNEYRKIYSAEYSGAELDNVVRREILGKVLANSFQNNFSTEGKTETQGNIISRIRELFQQFIASIRNFINPKIREELEDFTEQVNDLLYENQLKEYLNQENFENNTFVLYSTGKEKTEIKGMRADIIKALKIARQNIQKFSRSTAVSFSDKASIDRNVRTLQELADNENLLAQKQAAIEMLTVASSQINELQASIAETRNSENFVFGEKENARFENLTKNLEPLLGSIKDNIDNNPAKYPKKDWKRISSQIAEVQNEITELRNRASGVFKDVIEKDLVERIMQKHNLDEGYRAHVEAWLTAAKADTSLFHTHFGQITNSRDPILGLFSDVIERTMNGANQEFVQSGKAFHQRLLNLGLKESDLKKLFNKGYLIDFHDQAAIEQRLAEIRAEVRLKATGEIAEDETPSKERIEEIIELAKTNKLEELTVEQKTKYDNLFEQEMIRFQERPFTEEYYKKRDEKYKNLNIHQTTINQIRAYSAERAGLTREAKREDGTIDWTRLSLASEERLHALKRKRNRDKSLTNTDGTLKTGLSTTTDQSSIQQQIKDNLAVEVNGVWYYMDNAKQQDSEARLAIDLIKLDQQFIKELQDNNKGVVEVPQSFIDEVARIEQEQGKEAAIRFIEANSSIFFNQDFWEEMSEGGSYLDKVIDAADNLGEEDRRNIYEAVNNIRMLNNRRSNTMNQFRNANKPFETDASKMGGLTKEAIRELDEQIQEAYTNLSSMVTLEDTTEESTNPIYKNEPNEAYFGTIREEGLSPQEELEFIFKHSTSTARNRVATFEKGIKRYLQGHTEALTPSQAEFVESRRGGELGVFEGTPIDIDLALTIAYARTQLASYYKKLVPEEATDVFDAKEDSDKTAVEYLNSLINAQHVEIQPNYSFLEEENEFANPNFNHNYEGSVQPKRGTYESDEYKQMFAPDADGNPTRNKKLFEGLQLLKELQKETLRNYNLEGRHSLVKVPQITKKGADRFVDFFKRVGRGGISQAFNEMFNYRVDDIAYGETIQGVDVSAIPTYYTSDLKDSNELTDELFYSYMAMHQQSILHKHRRNNIGQALAIKDALGKRDYPKGKAAESTNTVKMFKNYMDYAFFGKEETQEFKITVFGKELDLTKFARILLDFVKYRNLAFSPIVAATSWFTAEVNLQIEKRVKEIINPSAERLGRKQYFKLASDAMKEVGKFQSKSKLNTLGEFFGIYNVSDRFMNSNYGWLARNSKNLSWGVHQMANFPIVPRAMLAILHDNRVVDRQIMNFAQFGRLPNMKDKTIKEREKEWKQYEDEAIFNYLDISTETVKFKDGFKGKLKQEFANDQYLSAKMELLTQQVKNAATKLDQQITPAQRVAAQRHFAMNYLMTHRSWLSITISNRTKNAHYNLNSGEHEEGTYRSFFKFIQDGMTGFIKTKNIKAFRDAYNGEGLEKDGDIPFERLLETRRRNLRRVAVDSLWLMGVGAVAYALMAFSDDDEDNWALQMASYLGLRTLNETVSSQTALPLQFYEVLESPFVGLNTMKDMATMTWNVFDSEVVKSGRYKGDTHRMRNFKKIMPGIKVIDDIAKAQNTKDNYFYYNKVNIMSSPVIFLELAFGEE